MKKAIGISLFLLFIGGAVLVPWLHEIHCADHDASTCSICQFANTSSVVPASHITPIDKCVVVGDVVVRFPTVASVSWRDPAHARAPPAC
jgi:hypothetical protein